MTGSYPTEIPYPATFQAKMAPAHLAAACALRGCPAPAVDQPYTYCELGSGTGFTANLLAAANPFAEFHAVDLNPDHVGAGTELARAGALANVHHHAIGFAEALDAGLPDFDFVALHGVWTWVDGAARRAVLRFLANKLRPGGLAYVSYTARPGMDAVAALRLLVEEAGLLGGDDPPASRVARVRAFLDRLVAAGPALGARVPALTDYVATLGRMAEASAIHDFLAPGWTAVHHREVRRAMATAGLEFAGDADLPLSCADLAFDPPAGDLVAEAPDAAAESLKDLLTQRPFRRDVYRRPAPDDGPPPPLGGLRLMLRVPPEAIVSAPLAAGRYGPLPDLLEVLAARLDGAPACASALLAAPEAGRFPPAAVIAQLRALLAAGSTVPAVRPPPAMPTGLPRLSPFNRAALSRPIAPDDARLLASPATGGGVALDRTTAYLVWAVSTAEAGNAARLLAARLAAEGRTLSAGGRTVGDTAGLATLLAPQLDRFAGGDLRRLIRLGVVA